MLVRATPAPNSSEGDGGDAQRRQGVGFLGSLGDEHGLTWRVHPVEHRRVHIEPVALAERSLVLDGLAVSPGPGFVGPELPAVLFAEHGVTRYPEPWPRLLAAAAHISGLCRADRSVATGLRDFLTDGGRPEHVGVLG